MKFKSKEQKIMMLNKMKLNNYDCDVIKANPTCYDNIEMNVAYYQSLHNMFIEEGFYLYDIDEETRIKCYFKKINKEIYYFVYEPYLNIYFEMIYNINNIDADINIEEKFLDKNNKKQTPPVIKELSQMVLAHIGCINYYATNSEVIHNNTIKTKTVKTVSKNNKKSNKNKKNNKKVVLTTKVINIPKNINKIAIKREYVRRTESWKVKGFWRTYKNGKKVWIKPSVRGNKKNNNDINIYELEGGLKK